VVNVIYTQPLDESRCERDGTAFTPWHRPRMESGHSIDASVQRLVANARDGSIQYRKCPRARKHAGEPHWFTRIEQFQMSSRISSRGTLSSPKPANFEWRKWPSGVHSTNSTCATRSGPNRTHFTSLLWSTSEECAGSSEFDLTSKGEPTAQSTWSCVPAH
jgi:hypothetical protein